MSIKVKIQHGNFGPNSFLRVSIVSFGPYSLGDYPRLFYPSIVIIGNIKTMASIFSALIIKQKANRLAHYTEKDT